MFKIVVGIILIIFSIFLIVAVLLQESKTKGLGGSITGGSSDTYFGKSKAQTRDKILSKLTMCVAIAFTAIVIVLYVGQNADKEYQDAFKEGIANMNASAGEDTTAADTTTVDTTAADTTAADTTAADTTAAETEDGTNP